MNDSSLILVILAAAVLAIATRKWQLSRSRAVLERWADRNGFELLASEYRSFNRGPFYWRATKLQTVHHVKVRDRGGNVRSGYVRCGGFVLGLLSDQTAVSWDNE